MDKTSFINMKDSIRSNMVGITEYMYYMALIIYVVLSMISSSMVMNFFRPKVFVLIMSGMLGILALCEALTFLFIKRYGIREIIGLGVCLFFWYIAEKNDSSVMLCSYFIIFCGRNIDLQKRYKIIVPLMILVIFGVMWAANEGYILQYTMAEEGVYRHTFGFGYPLVLPCYILNIASMIAVTRKEKASWTEIAVVFLVAATFYRWCKADLSFGVTVMVAMLILIVKALPKIITSDFVLWRIVDKILIIIFPLFFLLSLWISLIYDPSVKWMSTLDEICRGRLSLPHNAINTYGARLLGQRIGFVGMGLGLDGESVTNGAYNYVDNVYMSLLLRYGVLFSIIALGLLTVTMYFCYQKKMRIWLWVLSLWALHGLFEDKMHFPYYNSLLLIVGQAIQNVDLRLDKFRKH
ncbi:hypothetical protein [Oribacterium sp. C9]|uniref:hypothetical protein n=1 Tax=Oribacterium sp. C9 TaxID=1943579 RepID=UPI001115870E|nr:hypothetical protein [Oribacterium sp. C9]